MRIVIISFMLVFSMLFLFVGCVDLSMDTSEDNSSNKNANKGEHSDITSKQENNIDYILLGKYEQDGNLDNGPEIIQWIPLYEQNGNVMLISRYILDYKEFNDTTIAKATSWEHSSLRKWLNEDFFNSAFSSTEQNKIVTTQVQDYKSDNVLGDITSDKVFLLNKEQAFTYFTTDYDRSAISTPYAETTVRFPNDGYWLIDSYSSDLYKYLINSKGRNENNPRVNESEGVRPVIWIIK